MKLTRLIMIMFSAILLHNNASLAGQKDEYFSAQCHNYVKNWLKFSESKIDTKYSYWKLEKHAFNYYGEDSSLYCSLKKYDCEAAYTQRIEFYEVLPWGEREKHTHTCYFRRNGTVIDDGYGFRGLN